MNTSPPSTAPTGWLALCYLINADYHPYEVQGALGLSYDEFVAQVQRRLDDLCVSCKRQVVITQTWGRSIEMMQGNRYNGKS